MTIQAPTHAKNHDGWNTVKKALDSKAAPQTVYFYSREVWYCCIGHNIGHEEDGKGTDYSRPVVILKRCGPNLFLGVPLTSQVKTANYLYGIGNVNGRAAVAMIAQVRLFSSKRLINKIDTVPVPVFKAMKKAARNFIF